MRLQVKGERRVVIIDPKHSFEGLYPYPVHHPYDSYSMVDWERPDQQMWPMSGDVRGRVCTLQPGDTLFIPSCWQVPGRSTTSCFEVFCLWSSLLALCVVAIRNTGHRVPSSFLKQELLPWPQTLFHNY